MNMPLKMLYRMFISLWQHKDKRSIQNLDHYLHQATRFRSLNFLHDSKPDISFDERLINFTDNGFQNNSLEANELTELIRKHLESLPEDQRTIFDMHRQEDYTNKEIAEKLNISIKTVEKKMTLSLSSLRSVVIKFISLIVFLFTRRVGVAYWCLFLQFTSIQICAYLWLVAKHKRLSLSMEGSVFGRKFLS